MPREFKPQVITSNRLHDGVVLYKRGDDWTEILAEAEIYRDQKTLDKAMQSAEQDEADQKLISIYAFPVDGEKTIPTPLSMREVIRDAGVPSVPIFNAHLISEKERSDIEERSA
jgi:hypothetical protein